MTKPRFELVDLLPELLVERRLLARERLAVALDQVLDVAFVAAPEIGLLGLDLLVDAALLALEVLLLGPDRLGLDLQALDQGELRLAEGLFLVRERRLQLALAFLPGVLDRVDDLAAQRADLRLAAGDLALERVDLQLGLEALLLDMSALLERHFLAQLLAHLRLEAVLVLHRGFPDLDGLAPALDGLVLLLRLLLELVRARRRAPLLRARLGELLVQLV